MPKWQMIDVLSISFKPGLLLTESLYLRDKKTFLFYICTHPCFQDQLREKGGSFIVISLPFISNILQ